MHTRQNYGWLDRFRMIAALLVIAIHTSPLSSVNEGADFFLTRVLARIAVPFFLMVTGQFAASSFLVPTPGDGRKLLRYLKKTTLLYAFCILLYLPIGIYAGHYEEMNVGTALRMLFFDGTFYHLWYFPACMMGMLVVYLLSRVMNLRGMTAVSTILYVIGLFGDSYYGLVQKVPPLEAVYEFMFRISSYTRNGIFLAPLFLVLGMWMSEVGSAWEEDPDRQVLPLSIMGLALSFSVMVMEAFVLRHFQLQRHDSMYIALIPTMFFLYQCLLYPPKKPSRGFRIVSTWIYILHPAFIVVVRALAKLVHQTPLLVENSVVHYFAVAVLSVAAGFGAAFLWRPLHRILPLGRNAQHSDAADGGRGHVSSRRQEEDYGEDYDGQETEYQQEIDDGYEAPLEEEDENYYERTEGEGFEECPPEEDLSPEGYSEDSFQGIAPEDNIPPENLSEDSSLGAALKNSPPVQSLPEDDMPLQHGTGLTPEPPRGKTSVAARAETPARAGNRPAGDRPGADGRGNGQNQPKPPAPPQKPSQCARAWIELDAAALVHNVSMLRSRLPGHCRLMPAVKADAYGHGAALVAGLLNQMDVDAFCVACLSEGIALREEGITGEILILGCTSPKDFPLLIHYRLTQTVVDYSYAQELERFGETLHVHLAVDTGMHRIGIRCENVEEILSVYGMEHLAVDGIFTHLAASDSPLPQDRAFTDSQIQAFYQVVDILESRKIPCRGRHLLASYGILNLLPERKRQEKSPGQTQASPKYLSDLAADYVRPGIALYGVLSTKEDCDRWRDSLWPVLSLKTKVISVRTLYAGEAAGYGMAFTAGQDMRIAVLAIGYADGLPRELSNGRGTALIRGHRAPILGRICMDQTIVDVSGIPDLHTGDTAVLIGKSGAQEIGAGDLAHQCGTITNELLSRLGSRLERFVVSENP